MTREEFRDYVELLRSQDKISYDVYSGLIDGIDTLEQEPCEDAISREDALMALTGEWTESRDEILSKAIRRIKALPSVNPQESILEKIRAEIDSALSEEVLDDNRQQISDVGIGLEIALSIINNESSGKHQ